MKVRFLTQLSNLQKLDGFGGWRSVVKITVQIFSPKAAWIVERMVNTVRDLFILKAGGFFKPKWSHIPDFQFTLQRWIG